MTCEKGQQLPDVRSMTLSFIPSLKVSLVIDPEPSHETQVLPLLDKISIPNMQGYLGNLTSFNNRYYKSATGVEASTWILNTVKSVCISGCQLSFYVLSVLRIFWIQRLLEAALTSRSQFFVIVGYSPPS